MSDDAADAFEVLSSETRVAILQALVEHRRENPGESGMRFSELRKAVGLRDSGQFNYHLDRLVGRFVEKNEERYKLNYAGLKVTGAILSGAYDAPAGGEDAELDAACILCESTMSVRYREDVLSVVCANDHVLFQTGIPKRLREGRTLPETLDAAFQLVYAQMDQYYRGLCPNCYGRVESELTEYEGEEYEGYSVTTTCGSCGNQFTGQPGNLLATDETVRAFYADHGRPIREQDQWTLELYQPENQRTISTDPPTVEVSVTLDGERLTGVITEDATIESIERERMAEE